MSALAEHLRALPDERLAALITLRPDLVVPVPGDISALAARAQSRLSVARALDGLDRFTLEVLDALRLSHEGRSIDAVLALTAQSRVDSSQVRAAVQRLRDRLVVYGSDDALHIVSAVDEITSYPAGLGRPAAELDPAAAALTVDASRLRRTVLAAPPAARAALDRLAAGPPRGTLAGPPTADSPLRWLLDHHLVVALSADTVELPREVALLLRRDTGPLGALHPHPPVITAPTRALDVVDRAAAGQSLEAVRRTEAILDALTAEPAAQLRSGGLGVRDLRRIGRAAGVDEATAAVLVEVAYAAGLLGDDEPGYLPSTGYDGWRAAALAPRWRVLATAWLAMTRDPALVGQRDDRDRLVAPLSAEAERLTAPGTRRAVLAELAALPPGSAPTAEQLHDVLSWRAPRRYSRAQTVSTASILAEAATLGFIGLDALSGFGRQLLSEVDSVGGSDDPLGVRAESAGRPATALLAALLPEPVESVVVQADLTVVLTGPAEPALAAELALLTDAESASVFRVTPESVRRALDAGFSAADVHAVFAQRSRTAVPQALTYLIDDVARRHGGLRAGAAGSYLRGDDEALLTQILADRRLDALRLRRLAPTVLVSHAPMNRLLTDLRDAGYLPVPEDRFGAMVLTRPSERRAAARQTRPMPRPDPLAQPQLNPARAAGLVDQIRHGDAAARAARRAPVTVRSPNGAQAHLDAILVLQRAVRDKSQVWVGYVDAHGTPASRLMRPVSIAAGYLRAEDDRTEMLHTLALHRITAAQPAEQVD
jgi:Helicase conserved C-terminal domain